ncbi:MAG: glycosyltransferase 87 family protein, partial [Thermodesulfobacteriota bacterium]
MSSKPLPHPLPAPPGHRLPPLLLGLAGLGLAVACWQPLLGWLWRQPPPPVRLLLDVFDLGVYFRASRWVDGSGRLYQEVFSEYPLAANLVMAGVRWLAGRLAKGGQDLFPVFVQVWTSLSLILFLAVAGLTRRLAGRAWWLWLVPAFPFFALYRFDIYPGVCVLGAMALLARERWRAAGLALGLAVAFKGYPLFLLPVVASYAWQRRSARTAVEVVGLALLPILAGNLVVWATAGWQAMLEPYLAQAARTMNGESTVDAASYVLFWLGVADPTIITFREWVAGSRWLGLAGAAVAGLGGLFLGPGSFPGLVRAVLF